MNTFKVGDLVRLKSGGPAMTVYRDQGNGNFTCISFDFARDEMCWHSLPASCLKLDEQVSDVPDPCVVVEEKHD